MTTAASRTGFWTDQVWASIDDGVTTSAGAIRVAQNVFLTEPLANMTLVPADVFDPKTMSIAEGISKPFIELAVEFSLTNGQVNDDPTGKTAITLSKLAARPLALAEDMIILQGGDADLSGVQVESGKDSLEHGLLGVASGREITVKPPDPDAPTNSGGQILSAVAKGIALLTRDLQAPPFALIQDTSASAATWGSFINGAPAHTVLDSVLARGIYGTGAMPADTGLLIALGGDPTTIYIGSEAVTEHTHKGKGGVYHFRTFERVQYVARDRRAFVKLDFSYLSKLRQEEGSNKVAPATAGDTSRQRRGAAGGAAA